MIKYFYWIILTAAFFQDQVTTQCNNTVGCKECNNGGENCNRCSDGFWLDGTNCSRCPDNYLTCTDNNYCQSCLPKYYGIDIDKCKHSCSASCGDSGCNDVTGDCYVCQTGLYGSKCGLDCGLCLKSNCSSRACILGCKGGYFQVFSEPELSYCQPCKNNCLSCINSTYCILCNDGFYLSRDINTYGRGETQCNPCSAPINHCTSCSYEQNITCNRCASGYALSGNECFEKKCVSNGCLNGCNSRGICYDCVDDRIGEKCEYSCNSACAKCLTQQFCAKCRGDFYSQTCLHPCNLNCLSINNPSFNFGTGKCSYGCNNGFWGDWCENICSENCKEFAGSLSVCFQNGTCAFGCKDGLEVDNCAKTTSVTIIVSSSEIDDATRVVLKSNSYINASYIEGYKRPKAYIASLGATKDTMAQFVTFWEMVWQEDTRIIIMLTNLVESRGRDTRTVAQYHYTAWPDQSVPHTVVSLIEFRDKVEKSKTTNVGPIIVHCSAGIGRTGTYIALDVLINEGKAENSVDLFGCVTALRGQRVNLVQNLEQYIFLHHSLVYAFTCQPEPLPVSSLVHFLSGDNVHKQFQALSNLTALQNKESQTVTTNARKQDISGDQFRVKLACSKTDSMNAVYVDGYLQPNRYIIAQTPMPSNFDDFASLLYQENVGMVVALDEEAHHDKPSDKKIVHSHFNAWKKEDIVPGSMQAFMSLLLAVNRQRRTDDRPILIHCLDGAKKSGLVCAIAIMLEKLTTDRELSVINTICHVRGRRRSALQDFEQFKFCYRCVNEYAKTSALKDYTKIL